ncbi:hypothetical protein AB0B25_24285 [Nocardia sp. NPDC049190]|uniref:hypothetical protein n=1 Tax=Nocardia sp. NPDC049190 TaxID=3155650 RepID=UPI0033D4DCCA
MGELPHPVSAAAAGELLVGDRTLLIGHRTRNQLLIHPPAALDELRAASLRLTGPPRR